MIMKSSHMFLSCKLYDCLKLLSNTLTGLGTPMNLQVVYQGVKQESQSLHYTSFTN